MFSEASVCPQGEGASESEGRVCLWGVLPIEGLHRGGEGLPNPRYCHPVIATATVGMHPTGIHFLFNLHTFTCNNSHSLSRTSRPKMYIVRRTFCYKSLTGVDNCCAFFLKKCAFGIVHDRCLVKKVNQSIYMQDVYSKRINNSFWTSDRADLVL